MIELDIKGITVCGRSVELVISAFYQNVLAALNGNAARIEGQTFVHLIVHDVVLRLAINSIDRNIELYSIADRCIISRSRRTGGVLYLLGDGGLAILFVNGYVRVGGTQRAQGVCRQSRSRNNQIIAQWQVAYSGVSSSCSAVSSQIVVLCILTSGICKGLNFGTIAGSGRGNNAIFDSEYISVFINKVCPNIIDGVLIGGKALVGFQNQDTINLIGLARDGTIDGNATSTGSSTTLSCKRRDGHGANHSNCQQYSHEFLHCFFHGKSPFLFCPLPPPVFLYRGGVGV